MERKLHRKDMTSHNRTGARAYARQRICLVCHAVVADGDGVGHGYLPAITHQGACNDAVFALHRIYDRSARGRFRPHLDVLRLANGGHCSMCQAAS